MSEPDCWGLTDESYYRLTRTAEILLHGTPCTDAHGFVADAAAQASDGQGKVDVDRAIQVMKDKAARCRREARSQGR